MAGGFHAVGIFVSSVAIGITVNNTFDSWPPFMKYVVGGTLAAVPAALGMPHIGLAAAGTYAATHYVRSKSNK